MSICLTPARAAASRKNGAKSQGPKTQVGKARSSQNALKHGLCAEKYLVAGEDEQAFAAFEGVVLEELAPDGVLQQILAGRIVRAAWRLERAERIEAELFENGRRGDGDLALALIRDGHGSRSFDTLLRYRGSALAEFFRALRMLNALQDEARTIEVPEPARVEASASRKRNKPKSRAIPRETSGKEPQANRPTTPAAPPPLGRLPAERLPGSHGPASSLAGQG